MSTSAFAPSRAMLVEMGGEDLLQKPVTRAALRSLLASIKIKSATPAAALQHLANEGYHLLYAEDSMPSQKIVKRMLENAGLKCTVVDNGKAAVDEALNSPAMFDCILMDCNMPVMDGWEATRWGCTS
jgi:DNA-binding response OmpR family regulator